MVELINYNYICLSLCMCVCMPVMCGYVYVWLCLIYSVHISVCLSVHTMYVCILYMSTKIIINYGMCVFEQTWNIFFFSQQQNIINLKIYIYTYISRYIYIYIYTLTSWLPFPQQQSLIALQFTATAKPLSTTLYHSLPFIHSQFWPTTYFPLLLITPS